MMLQSQLHVTILVLGVLVLSACSEHVPVPPSENSLRMFSRDAEWQLDSIPAYEPFFHLTAIWGTGPSNVYAVGSGVMRFSGGLWQLLPMHTSMGGPVGGSVGLNDIHGSSPFNVWAVGRWLSSSMWFPLVLQYKGDSWSVVTYPGRYDDVLTSVWSSGPSRTWIGGRFGQIFHVTESSWKRDSLRFRPPSAGEWFISSFAGVGGEARYAIIFHVSSTSPTEVMYLVRRTDSYWDLVDSLSTTTFGCRNLLMTPSGTLYSAGRHLCRWNGSSWEILRAGSDSRSVNQVVGNADNNLFAVGGSIYGHSGFIDHYDGTDWRTVTDGTTIPCTFSDAYTDGGHVAALGWDYNWNRFVLRSN